MNRDRLFNKSLVSRACQLSECFEEIGSNIEISIYPDTLEHYEKCKTAWHALVEENLTGLGSGKVLCYKSVTIFKPRR